MLVAASDATDTFRYWLQNMWSSTIQLQSTTAVGHSPKIVQMLDKLGFVIFNNLLVTHGRTVVPRRMWSSSTGLAGWVEKIADYFVQ